MSPDPYFPNSWLLSWKRPIYEPVRCLGSKLDLNFATAFRKVKSSPKTSATRLISSTGVRADVLERSREPYRLAWFRGVFPNKRNKPDTRDFALYRSGWRTREVRCRQRPPDAPGPEPWAIDRASNRQGLRQRPAAPHLWRSSSGLIVQRVDAVRTRQTRPVTDLATKARSKADMRPSRSGPQRKWSPTTKVASPCPQPRLSRAPARIAAISAHYSMET